MYKRQALVSDKEGEPDLDYYLLAENTPAGKEGETVLTLVNLYQDVYKRQYGGRPATRRTG